MTTNKAKILTLDIETSPTKVYTWGLWDQNVGLSQIIDDGYVLCWSAKWLGQKEIMWDAVYKHSKPDKYSSIGEREIAKSIWKLLDEADIVITHNGDNFDLKWINSMFMKHNLPPVSDFKSVDTLKQSRRCGYLLSHKLEYLVRKFKLGRKIDTSGFGLWVSCMAGDKSAWKKMISYCCHDTRLDETLYKKLRPYMKNHPDVNIVVGVHESESCKRCASKHTQRRGFYYKKSGKFRKHQCLDCKAWFEGEKVKE